MYYGLSLMARNATRNKQATLSQIPIPQLPRRPVVILKGLLSVVRRREGVADLGIDLLRRHGEGRGVRFGV